jgi:hypothetical protein
MSKDLEMDAFEVSQVTGISIKAAQALVGQCYDSVGGYSLGWCIDRFDDAKRKALIQLGDEEEERLCKLNPPFWRR